MHVRYISAISSVEEFHVRGILRSSGRWQCAVAARKDGQAVDAGKAPALRADTGPMGIRRLHGRPLGQAVPADAPGAARAGRVFEQGDLKYVILRLLEEKPRHGYEIIKELEERFGGVYAPSPGTVYPTLTMLEDLGYARAMPEEGGRKIYEITDEGRKHLEEHSQTVDDIFDRIARFVDGFLDAPMTELNRPFSTSGRATLVGLAPGRLRNRELWTASRASWTGCREIEALGAKLRGRGRLSPSRQAT